MDKINLQCSLFAFLFSLNYLSYGQTDGAGWGNNQFSQTFFLNAQGDSVKEIYAGRYCTAALTKSGNVAMWGRCGLVIPSPSIFSSPVRKITIGAEHVLGLRKDSTVTARGNNDNGQSTIPVGLKNVVSIAAGSFHSLAVKSDGSVISWGAGFTNTTAPNLGQSIIPAGLTGVKEVAAGAFHSLALKHDGTVVAWGSNSYGEASVPAGLNNVISIDAGDFFSMALKANGTIILWGTYIAGFNNIELPMNFANGGVKMISAFGRQWIAIDGPNRRVVSYGSGNFNMNTPPVLENVQQVCVGYHHCAALKADGSIQSWGIGANPSTATAYNWGQTVDPIEIPADLVMMSSGSFHNLLLKADGTVKAWGAGKFKTTDNPNFGQAAVPDNLYDVVAVSAGNYHSLALKSDGTVIAWGLGTAGTGSGQAVVPAGLNSVKAIAAGGEHNLALKYDGTVMAWGANTEEQCDVPAGLTGVIAIAAGGYHSVALKYDGTVVCWGAGRTVPSSPPTTADWYGQAVVPTGLTNVKAISAGGYHTVVLKGDSSVLCWGAGRGAVTNFDYAEYGQSTRPGNLGKVLSIQAGWLHTMALVKDGSVANWGRMTNTFPPTYSQGYAIGPATPPSGLHGVTSIIAGSNNGIALTGNLVQTNVPISVVNGKLYNELIANCVNDPTETSMGGYVVKAEPGPYYAMSNSTGVYSLRLPVPVVPASLSLSALTYQGPGYKAAPVCPVANEFIVPLDTSVMVVSGKDFGYQVTQCHTLDVQIVSNTRRRCFTNTTAIRFRNLGNIPSPSAYILIEFPHFVKFKSSTRPSIVVNDSVRRFNLGVLNVGSNGLFYIVDSVLCGDASILGLQQCTKATIYPAPDCPVNSNWNGAEVSVSGTCTDGIVNLGIYNTGIANMQDSVDYWVYLDSIQVKAAKVKLVAGDSLKLQVQAWGMGVHLTVNQVPFHPNELFVTTTIEACDDTTISIPRPLVNHFPVSSAPNSKIHCLPIRGSYDPNDKQVTPQGFTSQHVVAPGTKLEYLLRFQNSGTDTAFTVQVVDTLDGNLDPGSFEIGAVSHPNELSMQTTKHGKTFLKWRFNKINLPDSTTNQLKSHGFIQFRILPKANMALGSQVRNMAAILFDYNDPVLTNHTLTTFDVQTFTDTSLNHHVSIVTANRSRLTPLQIGAKLYPNPVTNQELMLAFEQKGDISIYNMQGVCVLQKKNLEGKQMVAFGLPTGLYIARLQTAKGNSEVKFVVQ